MASKSRVKSTGFDTRHEFEAALDDVAAMTVELRRLEADRDFRLQQIQEECNEDILDAGKKIKGLVAQAEKYALSHRAEILPAGRKGGETALARFGFRTGNKTLVLLNKKWSWETVIEACKAAELGHFVNSKETVDKDGLKAKIDDTVLASIGCRVKQDEAFWVEPKLEDERL